MKLKAVSIIMVCLLAIVGCSKGKNEIENQYKLEDVTRAIESQDLELVPYGVTGNILTLNKTIPEMNAIETKASVDHSDPEYIYFYFFDTEKARSSGVKDFNKQMKNAKFTTYPYLYEKGNVLAIYWAKSNDKPLLDKSIKSAIENL